MSLSSISGLTSQAASSQSVSTTSSVSQISLSSEDATPLEQEEQTIQTDIAQAEPQARKSSSR